MTYCTQNDYNCEECSLVNYGRDCHNNLIEDTKEKTTHWFDAWIKNEEVEDETTSQVLG